MRINKSKFTPEELKLYESLIAKAREPEPNEGVTPEPNVPGSGITQTLKMAEQPERNMQQESTQKSAAADAPSPEIAAALAQFEELTKSIEMERCAEIAKKYSLLCGDESKLAQTLYNMKKSSVANYNAYLEILNKNLELKQQQGIFSEIGKTGHGCYGASAPAGSVMGRIQAAAAEIQKSNPGIDYATAMDQAWTNHPELLAEYENDYRIK